MLFAGWRELLDASRGNDHEVALRKTARPAVARVSSATAERFGLTTHARIEYEGRAQVLPVEIVRGMIDDVVWAPLNPGGDHLSVLPGTPVTVTAVTTNEGAMA